MHASRREKMLLREAIRQERASRPSCSVDWSGSTRPGQRKNVASRAARDRQKWNGYKTRDVQWHDV